VLDKQEIFDRLKDILIEQFEISAEEITLDAHLYEALDLDSIDAVDLIGELQKLSDVKIQPDKFKAVRTVSDVVDIVHELIHG
jgi:acyl carrier protein